jgi:hypothetical protein
MSTVTAPFTDSQVAALNAFQTGGRFHPFTCPHHSHTSDGDLVATVDGWACPHPGCDYTQDWAHQFMTEPVT